VPNRLIKEKSPYLLQHAHNPVDWHPWGQEALEKAKAEDKPVFLSIGYATCHWCHVMAHESFEDEDVARVLNELYVPIKVDREERPDIDQVYMTACQVLTGQGGWPLSAFLTPEGKPFYVGTYFPKTSRMGRPGFLDLLAMLAEKWRLERKTVLKAADQLTEALKGPAEIKAQDLKPDLEVLELGYQQLAKAYDPEWGGFGQAPKFPTPHNLSFLLRWHVRDPGSTALEMVEKTLTAMRQGGLFDQVGLGFARYSVDARWLVPHFEKMLYDQALLALAYLEAFQVTQKALYAQVAEEIFTYVLRDMTSPEGAFYSAEDADSEGREGLFYVWTPQEVIEELGRDLGELFCRFYDLTPAGNFEHGLSIPHMSVPVEMLARQKGIEVQELENQLDQARRRLFARREGRVRPLKDDKILTAWNGLMIAALARGSQVLGEPRYAQAATRAFDFLDKNLKQDNGTLLRRFRQGQAAYPGYLDDYAYLVWGLLELYETAFEIRFLEAALALNRTMLELFRDDTSGGLFYSGRENESLIARTKEVYDGALPSGNSVAALNLLRLGRMTGETGLETKADELIKAFSGQVGRYPAVHTHFLMALDFLAGPSREIVIAGPVDDPAVQAMIRSVRNKFMPNKIILLKQEGQPLESLAPFVESMKPRLGRPTFYLCQGYACRRPITDPAEVEAALEG